MATFYITKHALSAGIFEIEGEAETEGFHAPGQWWVKDPRPDSWGYFRETEAFSDKAEAVADAERRRAKKIASLRKQIAKLEKLTFWPSPASATIAERRSVVAEVEAATVVG